MLMDVVFLIIETTDILLGALYAHVHVCTYFLSEDLVDLVDLVDTWKNN